MPELFRRAWGLVYRTDTWAWGWYRCRDGALTVRLGYHRVAVWPRQWRHDIRRARSGL